MQHYIKIKETASLIPWPLRSSLPDFESDWNYRNDHVSPIHYKYRRFVQNRPKVWA